MEHDAPQSPRWASEVLALPPDSVEQRPPAHRDVDFEQKARAYGVFVAQLQPWEWFCTFTFRSPRERELTVVPKGQRSLRGAKLNSGLLVTELREYLDRMAREGGSRVSWFVGEEFGRIGGRWHCHAVVSHVKKLRSYRWWWESYQRWGHCRIEQARHHSTVGHYAAVYAAKQVGGIHVGGWLARAKWDGQRLRQMSFASGEVDAVGQRSLPGIPAPLLECDPVVVARDAAAAAVPDVLSGRMFHSDPLPGDFFHLSHVRTR